MATSRIWRSLLEIGTLIAFATFIITIAISGVAHFDPLCGEELIREQNSPDGRYVAAWMERNCGATTPFVEHINLRRANTRFSRGFFDGTIKQGEVFIQKDNSMRFEWLGSELVIEYPDDKAVFLKASRWNDVPIRYH